MKKLAARNFEDILQVHKACIIYVDYSISRNLFLVRNTRF